MKQYVTVCEEAARAGGRELLAWAGKFATKEKGPADLVTDADLASEAAVKKVVLAAFPEHSFLSEEHPVARSTLGEYCWIVDPLDGTTNYVHAVPHYCVSVALERNGEPLAGAVFEPHSGECFTAEKGGGAFLNGKSLSVSKIERLGEALVAASFTPRVSHDSKQVADFVNIVTAAQSIRRTGSAALNLCYVAAGRFDGFWARDINAWDIAAAALLVQEAGGVITAFDGSPFRLASPPFVAAGTQKLHAELLRTLQGCGV